MTDWRISGPDGEPYPDFADEDLRRDLPDLPLSKKQALHEALRIPPHRGALQGAQVNQRGQSILLNPGEEQNILDLRPMGEDSDVITICWGITASGVPEAEGGTKESFLRGLLEWGVGAANYTAEIDICQGLVIAIPANFVRVGARYEPQPAGPGSVVPYRVNASLSYGYIGQRSGAARFTDRVGTLAPGASTGYRPIPPFATSFTIVSSTTALLGIPQFAPCVFAITTGAPGNGLATGGSMASGSNLGNQIESQFPIQNSGRFIQLANNGVDPANYYIIYSLSL